MAKTLQLTFLTTGDKKVSLTVDEPDSELTAEEVAIAMDEIIQAGFFKVEDHPFKSAVSAKIIDRQVTELF